MEHNEPIESAYFNWLCAKVGPTHGTPSQVHWKLLRELHNTEFVWVEAMDENRALDGLDLRREFVDATHSSSDPSWDFLGCSVLEMLIAFSRRASFVTDRRPRDWFWECLRNLGIDHLSDAVYDGHRINDVLDRFIWRTYDFNGQGGLFPLQDPHTDQRRVEIWYQFCDYLIDQEIT